MWFKKKEVAQIPLCFHKWKLFDVRVVWTDNGVVSDYHDVITLGCVSCNRTRDVDELEYDALAKNGLIIEQKE